MNMLEKEHPRIHFISGLGADERAFQFLELPGYDKTFIQWVNPKPGEALEEYVKRLLPQIDAHFEVILVGMSFGGIVAQELAKIIKGCKTIIISSIKSPEEMDLQLKLVKKTGIYKFVPSWFLKWSNHLTGNYYFGVKSEAEKDLLHRIIDDTDPYFMKWAIGEIMKWEIKEPLENMVHIHGSDDKIFPVQNIKEYIRVEGAGHFMVVNRAPEISKILKEALNRN